MTQPLTQRMVAFRRAQMRRTWGVLLVLGLIVLGGWVWTLLSGQSWVAPADAWRVLMGADVPGASFTVGTLRLPRATLAVLAGAGFGMAGAAFQTMLRNPLASPDIIGITSGASAAAVIGIVLLGWNGMAVSILSVVAGLGVALSIYALSWRGGVAGTRLILVGIGISAMLNSTVAYVLSRAPAWNAQEAMRWMTGSLNGAQPAQSLAVAGALVVFGGLLLTQRRNLDMLGLGDDAAAALGVGVARTRVIVVIAAVGLISIATAATGPIAFLAFLAGPIAARIVGPGQSRLIAAAMVGAALALIGDYAGQFLLPSRYPVGVVTGALGAPFLLYLIVRANRTGGST